jgi:hypothetical protein
MSLGLFGRAAGMQAPRLLGAWFDSERSGWAVWILLALFVVVWTAFHTISNAAIDLRDDITEIYTWSRTLRPGYYKHPPLGALMAAPWFTLFPATDWSFRLFAMLNAALALFAVDLIARRYLTGDKRLLALLLLLLTPFYQFFSERFASNQTLLATWPLATYCFLRAFETRGFWWSARRPASRQRGLEFLRKQTLSIRDRCYGSCGRACDPFPPLPPAPSPTPVNIGKMCACDRPAPVSTALSGFRLTPY